MKISPKVTRELSLKIGNAFCPGRFSISSGKEQWCVPVMNAPLVLNANDSAQFLVCSPDGNALSLVHINSSMCGML